MQLESCTSSPYNLSNFVKFLLLHPFAVINIVMSECGSHRGGRDISLIVPPVIPVQRQRQGK